MSKNFFFCAFCLLAVNFLSYGQQKIVFKTGQIAHSKTALNNLFLAGDFNNWNASDTAWQLHPDGSGSLRIFKTLPKGLYHFKITRGNWQTVECNSFGKPIDNRILNLVNDTTITMNIAAWQDNFAAEEKKHTASKQVHIISEKFEMPQLGRERRIWIYLPADYQTSKRTYPVIYMHDGQNLFDNYTAGFGEWGIDELLDQMPDKNECIVVGIDHAGDQRITEYNPYDSKYGKGRGNDYVDFIAKTLKPFIDAHYRTQNDAKHTTIAGSSMGGLISMYAALKYPNVFGNAGIFSPAFWIAPDVYQFAQQQPKISARFYFVCGDAESDSMVADMQKMAAIVYGKSNDPGNAPVIIVKGASHNEKQWNGDFTGFYNWLLKGF